MDEEKKIWIFEEELEKAAICHRYYLSYTAINLQKKSYWKVGMLKIRGKIIRIVKYAETFVLLS